MSAHLAARTDDDSDVHDAAEVVVVGSVNVDVVAELTRFPYPGETVAARSIRRSVGGKGANQAVAACRAGARVAMVARVGDDPDGAWLRAEVGATGVDVTHVSTVSDARSGTAFIQVADGENVIVLDGGANQRWDRLDDPSTAAVRAARVIVCQMEIPDDVVTTAATLVGPNARFVLNAAPARPVAPDLLRRCDPLVVNEHEVAVLADADVVDAPSAVTAAERLIGRGARSVVVTLGADGAVWIGAEGSGRLDAPRVDVVDSTGAGDAFVGTLATRIARGDAMDGAVRAAIAAGARAVTRAGAF